MNEQMNVQRLRRWNKGFALRFKAQFLTNTLLLGCLFPLQKNIQFLKLILNTYIVETANSNLCYVSIMIVFNVQAITRWAEGECLKFIESVKDKLCNYCIQNFIHDFLQKNTCYRQIKQKTTDNSLVVITNVSVR